MVELRHISNQDINMLKVWFNGDIDGLKYVSYYRDVDAWLKLMTTDLRQGWIISDNGIDVGFIDLEIQGITGSFAYYIAPNYRLKGYSTHALSLLEQTACSQNIELLEGYFEPDNVASRGALIKAGYTLASVNDSDGMIKASKKVKI